MRKALISVVVPVYKVEKYLADCVDSILGQTYKNIEVILVDDGSPDNSGIMCDEYKTKDKRIRVIHKSNGGLSSARNCGLENSKGNFICFIDSDDYLEPNYLEELKNNMDYYDSDISVCNFIYHKNDTTSITNFETLSFCSEGKDKFNNLYNAYSGLTVTAWNKLYKRKVFDNVRYPEGKIFEDSFIVCNLLDNAKKVSYILKPLYNYICRKESISTSFALNHFDKIEAYDIKIDFISNKGYYDLVVVEKSRKMLHLIKCLAKMERYGIKNKEVWDKYYKELVEINKEVKWKDSNKYDKFYKIFRRLSISMLALMYRLKQLLNK